MLNLFRKLFLLAFAIFLIGIVSNSYGQTQQPTGAKLQVLHNLGGSTEDSTTRIPRKFAKYAKEDSTGRICIDSTTTKHIWYHDGTSWVEIVPKSYVDSAVASGEGATPGGANGNIQFNQSGSFGGNSSMIYDVSTQTFKLKANFQQINGFNNGFFGADPIPQPSDDIMTALEQLGLINDPAFYVDDITATGTPSSTTFLRGDGTWAPAGTGTITNINTTAPLTGGPITTTGTISIPKADGSTNGYIASIDWTAFNNKQPQLNGTGFVKASGTAINYDNSTYITTETDPLSFHKSDSNTNGNAVTLSYYNAHLPIITPYTAGYGLNLSSNTFSTDSFEVSTKAYRQKGVDSVTNWAAATFLTGNQNITLSGDVTGVGTTSIATTIKNNLALGGSPTTTTQSTADNSTKIATTAYVKNQGYSTTTGTVTSVGLSGGTGISVSGSPITSSGTVTVTATGSLSAGSGINVAGSFPVYTVTNTSPSSGGTVTSVKVVSNAAAYSVTPTGAITSSGIYSIVPTGSSSQFVKGDGSFDGNTYLTSAVTSVGMSVPSIFTVTPSAITSTGTFSVTLVNENPHTFLAGATSGTTTPTFRALSSTDLPALTTTVNGTTVTIGSSQTVTAAANTLTTATLNPTVVTSSLTSVGAVGTGTWTGTIGAATMQVGSDATGDIYYRNAGGTLTRLPIGTSTNVLVGGTTPGWGSAPSSGSSAAYGNNRAFQWDSLNFQAGSQYIFNSITGDLGMVSHTYSVDPTPTSGSNVLRATNQTGIDQLSSQPSIGVPFTYQASIAQKTVGYLTPGVSGTFNTAFSWQGGGGAVWSATGGGGTITNSKTYDATNHLPNYTYYQNKSSAATNSSAEIYINAAAKSFIVGNNTYGSQTIITVAFGMPIYSSTERVFMGYQASAAAALSTTTDPSSFLNSVGVGKDAADATLQVMFNNGSGTATKVNTGFTPNVNDVYRVTIFIPSNGAASYVTVEDISKSGRTIFIASNSAKIPNAGTFLYPHMYVNTAASSTAVAFALITLMEEQY